MSIAHEVRSILGRELFPGGPSHAQAIALKLVKQARQGDTEAAALVFALASQAEREEPEEQLSETVEDNAGTIFDRVVARIRPDVEDALERGFHTEAIKAALIRSYVDENPDETVRTSIGYRRDLEQAIDTVITELVTV